MVNVKSKSNVRTGGAVTSPNVDFINTGHAAQSRYIAALTNPFAAPAVPIPDSFLKAHCAKAGLEQSLVGVKQIKLTFHKTGGSPTGNYRVAFDCTDVNGAPIFPAKLYDSLVGTRLVAAGLSFEDGAKASDVGGFVTYSQRDAAYDGTSFEDVMVDSRTERNYGYGTLTYNLNRRQALDFEGDSHIQLKIEFSEAKDLVVRFVAIVECDGQQGFSEGIVAQNDYVITQTIQNHHAGVFGDTPHPKTTAHLPPHLTTVAPHTTHHFSDMWHTAANWVSSAAGWAWKHKPQITAWAQKAEQVYRDVSAFRGSITAARTGEIMSLGARAAPLLLA
jgi:hypothetical protein